jgi:hypothetical protein
MSTKVFPQGESLSQILKMCSGLFGFKNKFNFRIYPVDLYADGSQGRQ